MKIAIINSSPNVYNLATERIAKYHRDRGDSVALASGSALFTPEVWTCDKAYFSCIFTWDLPAMIESVNKLYNRGKEIEIGGPAATAMPQYIEKETGLKPHVGLDNRFENILGDFKMAFTSRGCRNNCGWCIVPKIEPEAIEYDYFSIPIGKNPFLGDNNILATSWDHQKRVVERCKDIRNLDINSGFEAELFYEEHFQLYNQLHLERWRLAFDSMKVEKEVERAVGILKEHGIRYSYISTYVLIGFPGTTMEEAMYRLNKTRDLGCTPYPQRYVPLKSLSRRYAAPGFDDYELERLRTYWVSPNTWRSCTWEEYKTNYKPDNLQEERLF